MRSIILPAAIVLSFIFSGCGVSTTNMTTSKPAASATPVPTASVPKNGDYIGRGKVTKINNDLGSIELDHEEINGVMPPMTMEFFVSDKSMLKNIKVGDPVEFTLRYKDGQETIIAITKAK